MKTAILGVVVLVCLAAAGPSWAISSEPVYLKNPEQIQALKGGLESLHKLLTTQKGVFENQDKLATLVQTEIDRLGSIKKVDATTKIDVTKIYRALDAEGKSLALKNRAAGSPVLSQMAECIDHVSSANDYTPRWKWIPMP